MKCQKLHTIKKKISFENRFSSMFIEIFHMRSRHHVGVELLTKWNADRFKISKAVHMSWCNVKTFELYGVISISTIKNK